MRGLASLPEEERFLLPGAHTQPGRGEDRPREFLSAASVPALLEFASAVTVALIEGRTARDVARIEARSSEEPETF